MKSGAPGSFGTQLKALREAAGFTQEELATIAGLSVHAVAHWSAANDDGRTSKPFEHFGGARSDWPHGTR
jgi:hypothetical protein